MKRKNWYPLDNAAKIYPPTTNAHRGGVFSLVAVLSETVDKGKLSQAVDVILKRFEGFKVRLRRGIFWYYLEENNKTFNVEEEPAYFLHPISANENNGYLFRVFYSGNRITMTVYHALCDGTGGVNLFKSLLYEYLILCGKKIDPEDKITTCVTPYTIDETTDSFNYLDYKTKDKPAKEVNAFKTDGTSFGYDGCGIMSGQVNLDQLKAECKKYDTTITVYLSALYMYCLYLAFIKDKRVKNKNIKLLIPVNLRKWYPSHTLRNFAMFVRLRHDFEQEITLEDCIKECKNQLKEGLTEEKLRAQIWSNVKAEKNWFLKIVPLAIKDIVMRMVYNHVGDNLHTANVSNLGVFDLPKSMTPYVKDVAFLLGTSYSCKTHMSVISYEDVVTISFTREMVENDMEKYFFRALSEKGIKVRVDSNYWEAK